MSEADVEMPGMTGTQVAAQLVQTHPETVVVYMSGYTDDSITQPGALVNGTHFIQKPFSPAALASKLRTILDESR